MRLKVDDELDPQTTHALPSPFAHAPLVPTIILIAIWAACILAQASYFRHLKPAGQWLCVMPLFLPFALRNSTAGRVCSALSIIFVLLTVSIGVSTAIAEVIWPAPPFVDHYRPHYTPAINGGLAGLALTAISSTLYLRSRWREADRDAQILAISGLVLFAFALYHQLVRG